MRILEFLGSDAENAFQERIANFANFTAKRISKRGLLKKCLCGFKIPALDSNFEDFFHHINKLTISLVCIKRICGRQHCLPVASRIDVLDFKLEIWQKVCLV